jgi:hypothetical protein
MSLVARWFVASEMCLPSRCLETGPIYSSIFPSSRSNGSAHLNIIQVPSWMTVRSQNFVQKIVMPWRHIGERRYGSTIFYLCVNWRWVGSLTPRGNSPRYPLNTRLDGTQSRSGHCVLENIFLFLPGIKRQPSKLQHVAISNQLFPLIAAITISKKFVGHALRINEAFKKSDFFSNGLCLQ